MREPKETSMQANRVRKPIEFGTDIAASAGEQVARSGRKVIQTTTAFSNAAGDELGKLRRAVTRGLHTAEDFKREMAVTIKRHPFRLVGIVAGISLGSGVMVGWILRR